VSVPVGLYAATTDQTIHFNQLRKGTSHRIRYKKIDEETGEELSSADIVNGYPVGGGEYIVVEPEEMKSAAPGKSDLIEIQDFVDLEQIDPKFFRQTYFLGPKGKGADRAYTLLRQAMAESHKVGIATVVLRDKEHLVAIRPGDEVLMMETMYFEDEIRDPREEIGNLPDVDLTEGREIAVAKQLIDALSATWDPSRYKNTYRDRVEALIENKRSGNAVVSADGNEPRQSNVVDLMSALESSLQRSRSGRNGVEATAERAERRPRRRSAKSSTTSGHEQQSFSGMGKAELLEQATRLRLKVNAKMTKPQLVAALAAAEPSVRSSRRQVS
jgi:DNA end-binding protein Ku